MTKKAFLGETKEELLQHLHWIQQTVAVAQVMKDWTQEDRLRTLATVLIALMCDESSNEEQVERIQTMVMVVTPCISKGLAERMADEDHMCKDIRAELAKLTGGSN